MAKIFNDAKSIISKHSPEILTGLGIVGMITTTVLAVKETPKALQIIKEEEEYREELRKADPEIYIQELSTVDIIKMTWKCYIPAAISGAFSIACIVSSNSVNAKRNAALATAYKLSEEAFSIYKDKVIETIGEKKEKSIHDKVDKERIDRKPVSTSEVYITGAGEYLCFDVISGRYFQSDIEKIRRIQNDLNSDMLTGEPYISLSQFYDALGLAHTNVSDRLGWNLYREGKLDIHFGSQIADDGRPCVVVDYMVEPRYEFDKLM